LLLPGREWRRRWPELAAAQGSTREAFCAGWRPNLAWVTAPLRAETPRKKSAAHLAPGGRRSCCCGAGRPSDAANPPPTWPGQPLAGGDAAPPARLPRPAALAELGVALVATAGNRVPVNRSAPIPNGWRRAGDDRRWFFGPQPPDRPRSTTAWCTGGGPARCGCATPAGTAPTTLDLSALLPHPDALPGVGRHGRSAQGSPGDRPSPAVRACSAPTGPTSTSPRV